MSKANTASLLLRYMSWNKERLIEKYMDNAASISVKAGIVPEPKPPPPVRTNAAGRSSTSSVIRRVTRRNAESSKPFKSPQRHSEVLVAETSKPFVCPICYDDAETKTMALSCGHQFCINCWKAYITSKVCDEAEHCLRCMAEGCAVFCPEQFLKDIHGANVTIMNRYHELVIRHFVACDSNLKYCPYPSCTFTVSCSSISSNASLNTIVPIVTCGASPKHVFCFGCHIDSDHRPLICAVGKLWLKKCHDDSETANWIKSHTKECPNCQSTIEKNGGCK
jgi:ariadne-1